MIAAVNCEAMRPAFEAWLLTQPDTGIPAYARRRNNGDYDFLDTEKKWRAWCGAMASIHSLRSGPTEPNHDMVICPTCTSQFTAIPVNIQDRLAALEAPPAIPVPSHVHCQCCGEPQCPGVKTREALPLNGPAPEQIRRIRMDGRNEALELLTNFSAEKFIDQYFGEHAIGDSGDRDVHWETDKLRELLEIGEYPYSVIDRLDAAYWTQQAFITGLQVQLSEEWLPIEAAESEKDGRYILGWFENDSSIFSRAEGEKSRAFVAAVRWAGGAGLWGFPGITGLMPTRFKRITGPDGKPIGYIRDQAKPA